MSDFYDFRDLLATFPVAAAPVAAGGTLGGFGLSTDGVFGKSTAGAAAAAAAATEEGKAAVLLPGGTAATTGFATFVTALLLAAAARVVVALAFEAAFAAVDPGAGALDAVAGILLVDARFRLTVFFLVVPVVVVVVPVLPPGVVLLLGLFAVLPVPFLAATLRFPAPATDFLLVVLALGVEPEVPVAKAIGLKGGAIPNNPSSSRILSSGAIVIVAPPIRDNRRRFD